MSHTQIARTRRVGIIIMARARVSLTSLADPALRVDVEEDGRPAVLTALLVVVPTTAPLEVTVRVLDAVA